LTWLHDDGIVVVRDEASQQWRDDVVILAEARFERRLAQEIGSLQTALVREIATTRSELIKWSFLFWVGQVVAFAGLLALALHVGKT
jgi:hypothetical protein